MNFGRIEPSGYGNRYKSCNKSIIYIAFADRVTGRDRVGVKGKRDWKQPYFARALCHGSGRSRLLKIIVFQCSHGTSRSRVRYLRGVLFPFHRPSSCYTMEPERKGREFAGGSRCGPRSPVLFGLSTDDSTVNDRRSPRKEDYARIIET